jgi:formate dehydrogenase subunit beta
MIDAIRARLAELLSELDGVVALQRTTAGTAPYLYKDGDDISQVELHPRYPLAPIVSLLHKRYPEVRIGVVARACDIRALVEMAKRQQVDPERLHIVAVACSGQEIEDCYCSDPVPRTEDWPQAEVIGTPVARTAVNPIVAEYENMSLQERGAFWQRQFAKCIKCYGCRNICPECFCERCALEDPLWVEPGKLAPPFPTYHLIRAMHMSGRCVACRQCELTCPAHIPLTILHDLIRRDVDDLLEYVPGTDLNASPPLSLTLEHGRIGRE